jgi:uncharacterized membrane protein YhaH (DUF805 family)
MSNNQFTTENSNKFQEKYFDFTGRISGTTYFLRAFLANILSFIAGYLCGYGWVASSTILVFGAVMLFLCLWYSLATVYKRANAIDPKNVQLWTGAVAIISGILLFDDGGGFFKAINVLGIVIHIYFVFQNANPKIEKN